MITEEVRKKYIPTIGIECHVQLKTKTKLFAAVNNDAREAEPNTLISHICVGLPGALPVLNEKALELATRAAFALNTEPQRFSKFDRKHYFYPDLPKGYQITQYDQPIIKGGFVEIEVDGKSKKININRVHLEEDAGKNTHPTGTDYSLVDLNRAGTPLIEIVSKPDINSPAEAKAYARELWLIMKYADVTDGDLYHGHVRFDVNISVSKTPGQFGKRAEIKNLNSFKSVENSVEYEINRQIERLEKGEKVEQETRGWDEAKQKTTSQRSKEEAHDYRYMPEPDIPPIELYDEHIEKIRSSLNELPATIRKQLYVLKVDKTVIEGTLDNSVLVPRILEAIKKTNPENARHVLFQMMEFGKSLILSVDEQIEIADMVNTKLLSSSAAKDVLMERLKPENIKLNQPERPKQIAERLKLLQLSDEGEIEQIVTEVIAENPKAAEDVKKGEMKVIGFLVGQVMAKSKGQANPGLAQEIIKKQLGV
jgi:aspartyl-tRNA(Asn)/glutamyl-tRNA(Gln) amidotransferase subunit B